jgi:hypothetical protein
MAKKKLSKKDQSKIGQKIAKILREGVRKNTKKPVSKSNPRRPVSPDQAKAIAFSMAKKGKL